MFLLLGTFIHNNVKTLDQDKDHKLGLWSKLSLVTRCYGDNLDLRLIKTYAHRTQATVARIGCPQRQKSVRIQGYGHYA